MIDLWIFDKFNILPTDEKFLNLYDEQKIALFDGICSLPDQSSLRKNVMLANKIEEIENRSDSDFIGKGFIKRITKQHKEAGHTEKEINKIIKNIIETKRSAELEKLKNE